MYSAINIIEKYQELLCYAPVKEWLTPAFKEDRAKMIRYKQLKSLCYAYGIEIPKMVENGNFLYEIKDFPIDDWKRIVENEMKLMHKEGYFINLADWMNYLPKSKRSRKEEIEEVIEVYKYLMQYRTRLQSLMDNSVGIIDLSGYKRFLMVFEDKYNKLIYETKVLEKVDGILGFIISPDGKEFTQYEMNNIYNYPIEDANSYG